MPVCLFVKSVVTLFCFKHFEYSPQHAAFMEIINIFNQLFIFSFWVTTAVIVVVVLITSWKERERQREWERERERERERESEMLFIFLNMCTSDMQINTWDLNVKSGVAWVILYKEDWRGQKLFTYTRSPVTALYMITKYR